MTLVTLHENLCSKRFKNVFPRKVSGYICFRTCSKTTIRTCSKIFDDVWNFSRCSMFFNFFEKIHFLSSFNTRGENLPINLLILFRYKREKNYQFEPVSRKDVLLFLGVYYIYYVMGWYIYQRPGILLV